MLRKIVRIVLILATITMVLSFAAAELIGCSRMMNPESEAGSAFRLQPKTGLEAKELWDLFTGSSAETPSSDVLATVTIAGQNVNIPVYAGEMAVVLNNDIPFFTPDEMAVVRHFETYSPLDDLGRCGPAYANVCLDTMPTEERGDISWVFPSGWKQAKYGNEWAYNRCHLIAFMLAGENDNPNNLITGTRAFNVDGMLPYESMVAQTVHNYNADVLYRVTPVFVGTELVARGVVMEAYCLEYPEECTFCRFVYNVGGDFNINYQTGQTSSR